MLTTLKHDINIILLTLGIIAMTVLYAQYKGLITLDHNSYNTSQAETSTPMTMNQLLDNIYSQDHKTMTVKHKKS